MAPLSSAELFIRQFRAWEMRGRGWIAWPGPVPLEPPFLPFSGYASPIRTSADDAQFETPLSRLADAILGRRRSPEEGHVHVENEAEPVPDPQIDREDLVELQVLLPARVDLPREPFEQFLQSLHLCREPVAFEVLAVNGTITVQFAVGNEDARLVEHQLRAFFPEAVFLQNPQGLAIVWGDEECAIAEFGLGREFMRTLATQRLDPLVGITGAMSELSDGERALFQVIFQPVRRPWAESIVRAISDRRTADLFTDAPELVREARRKVAAPLYAAVARIAAVGASYDRAWDIARHLASSLRVFANPAGNELIPLHNDDYPHEAHVSDLRRRQCRRSGMLLNIEELTGFVHLPSVCVRTPALTRQIARTKAAPEYAPEAAIALGYNLHAGRERMVMLPDQVRLRHVHIIGATGTGKSTLLAHMVRQDLERGAGLALLDPHGDLADELLPAIPPARRDDVVFFDPTDVEFPIGFNILAAHGDAEKELLASDLIAVFARLSTSWGDQMASVLQNAILAFLESSVGGTLIELRRFLIEPAFRDRFLRTVRDPDIVYYWKKGFGHLSGSKSIGPIITRLEMFLSRKTIRYMVSQRSNRLDFGEIMHTGRVFVARLPQGQIGIENAYLLGSLLVSKFQQAAMARQAQTTSERRPFWLYLDEFQHFATPSMATILSGARKYGLGLILAHQELEHLTREHGVASAVLNNAATRICFRVGDDDARRLADGFSTFESSDLRNLAIGEAIARIDRNDADFNLKIQPPETTSSATSPQIRDEIVAASRRKYGTARAEVESMLAEQLGLNECAEPREGQSTITLERTAAAVREPPEVTAVSEPRRDPASAPVSSVAPSRSGSQPATRASSGKVTQPGRGGAQHRAIVERIKAAAEGFGYRVAIEKQVLDGAGSIDLALEKPEGSIACEISVTTSVDHEVGNVAKCLSAGFTAVAMVSADTKHLDAIRVAVAASLGAAKAGKVGFFTPDAFLAHLQSISPQAAEQSAEPPRRRGYIVKRSVAPLTPDERKARDREAITVMAELMKRKA